MKICSDTRGGNAEEYDLTSFPRNEINGFLSFWARNSVALKRGEVRARTKTSRLPFLRWLRKNLVGKSIVPFHAPTALPVFANQTIHPALYRCALLLRLRSGIPARAALDGFQLALSSR